MYHNLRRCRACGYGPPLNSADIKAGEPSQKLESILNLGVMPLPNAFRREEEARPGHYPIELLACPRCHLGQLSAVVDPGVMYSNYPYVTSPSETMRAHFCNLWDMLHYHSPLRSIVEIGSNDGLLLEHFVKMGATQALGIDPAANLVKLSCERGIPAYRGLFDRDAANYALDVMPTVDLVLARHVFCHVNDWHRFVDDVTVLCAKETIVYIEVPYAHDTIANCEWDQIYAEHLSYLTLRSVQHLLEGSALRLHHVVRFPVHGGSIGILLRRRDSQEPVNPSVQEFLEAERCELPDWRAFGLKALDQIANLKILVRRLRSEGNRVVGYGASAKSTVWINACNFRRADIEGVYDYTPQKLWTCIPGTDIPVRHEGAFYADAANYAINFCWNYAKEVQTKQAKWVSAGGRFIVPVPEVRIV